MYESDRVDTIGQVQRYLEALANHDRDSIAPLFSDDIVESITLSATGDPAPAMVFTGKEEVLGYQDQIIAMFSQVQFTNAAYTRSEDGDVVFFEGTGDLIASEGNVPYHNVYVLKFHFRDDGTIDRIWEYANPIPFNNLIGAPIG